MFSRQHRHEWKLSTIWRHSPANTRSNPHYLLTNLSVHSSFIGLAIQTVDIQLTRVLSSKLQGCLRGSFNIISHRDINLEWLFWKAEFRQLIWEQRQEKESKIIFIVSALKYFLQTQTSALISSDFSRQNCRVDKIENFMIQKFLRYLSLLAETRPRSSWHTWYCVKCYGNMENKTFPACRNTQTGV